METRNMRHGPETIYDSLEEFNQHKPGRLAEDWRKAEVGDYVIHDDGRVARIVTQSIYKYYFPLKRQAKTLRSPLCGGMFPEDPQSSPHTNHKGAFVRRPLDPNRLTRADKRFAKALLLNIISNGGITRRGLINSYSIAYGYKSKVKITPNSKKVYYKAWDIIKTKGALMDEVKNQLKVVAEQVGLSEKWVFENLKQIGEEGNDKYRLEAIKEVKDLLSLTEQRHEQQYFTPLPGHLTKAIEAGEHEENIETEDV